MVARTSGKASIANEQGWQINGAGLEFNPKFGFGVMNADRLVISTTEGISSNGKMFPDGMVMARFRNIPGCK